MSTVSAFMEKHYRHFNARETIEAAREYKKLLAEGGQMLVAMAGAMSTGELGISLAEMIRQDKVHAICCTAANLEEDVFNLFAHNDYRLTPRWRNLTTEDERKLRDSGYNRVTDTCIPETVMKHTHKILREMWTQAAERGESRFPYEYMYELLDRQDLKQHYQIPPENSWLMAAKDKGLPVFAPGLEDSTLGNMFCGSVMLGKVKSHSAMRSGTEQMQKLAEWYLDRVDKNVPVGFFQIGGGIAGDFAICVVPMLIQDLERDVPLWAYFAQISDSTPSYGSYSGAIPSEKITWWKLDPETPMFNINSDASIVAPLIFAYVLGQ